MFFLRGRYALRKLFRVAQLTLWLSATSTTERFSKAAGMWRIVGVLRTELRRELFVQPHTVLNDMFFVRVAFHTASGLR